MGPVALLLRDVVTAFVSSGGARLGQGWGNFEN